MHPIPWRVALVPLAILVSGCSEGEKDGRAWVEAVVRQTPAIVQLVFQLPEAPQSHANTTGVPPQWIRDVSFERFAWSRLDRDRSHADAVVVLSPGPDLPRSASGSAVPTRVRVDISVDFRVHETRAPFVFGYFWSDRSLEPDVWTLHRVGGRAVEARGVFVSGTL